MGLQGLRERKRRRVGQDIEDAAAELFADRGVDRVRMGEIAERALVSEATLYNYYANKAALAEVWVRRRLGRVAAKAAAAFGAGATPLASRQAGRAIAMAVARAAGEGRSWLEPVWGRTARSPGGPDAGAAPRELAAFFRDAQEAGEVRADVAAEELAELLWAGIEARIRAWLTAPAASRGSADPGGPAGGEDLVASLRRAVDVVMDGSRKRHERVRASAATRPVPPAG